jgi:GntR family transcriptional repressor for pyruvate dehydrogenase complex
MIDKQKFSMLPIKRTDVFQEIISRIDSMIANGQYKPGDRFPSERELAETMKVSRTSVRQALKVLEAAGKIETRIGSGTYVLENSERGNDLRRILPAAVDKVFLEQLIAARAGIERTIFEECCDRIDDAGLAELYSLIAENARDFVETELDENGGLDLSFESKVAELVGNPILFRIQQEVHQVWVLAWNAYGRISENKKILHAEHLELLAAMERRDKERISRLIVAHVNKDVG